MCLGFCSLNNSLLKYTITDMLLPCHQKRSRHTTNISALLTVFLCQLLTSVDGSVVCPLRADKALRRVSASVAFTLRGFELGWEIYCVKSLKSKSFCLRCCRTVRVPLVLPTQQQQEVLHLHHAVMGAVVRHYWNRHKVQLFIS